LFSAAVSAQPYQGLIDGATGQFVPNAAVLFIEPAEMLVGNITDLDPDAATLVIGANATVSGANTGDQTITLTGDVTGAGTGSFPTAIAGDTVGTAELDDGTSTATARHVVHIDPLDVTQFIYYPSPSGGTDGCSGAADKVVFNSTTGTWGCGVDAGAGGGMTGFTVAGDTGGGQSITDANTLSLLGGTAITTADSAVDTVTFSVDVATLEPLLSLQNLGGAVVDAQVPDTITISLAATASALAANGANCLAGSYPLGVDASGAAESCTDATTEIDSAITTHAAIADAHQALVTLAGQTYLTILGQEITAAAIGPTNLAATDFGDFTCNGTTCSLDVAGSGDVVGPALSTDNAVARFDGTTGKLLQNSPLIVEDLTLGEVNVGLVSPNDTIHIVSNPTSDECGMLIGPDTFGCPTNKGTYSLVTAVGDNGTYRQGIGIYATDDLTTVGLLHGYNTDQLHAFEFDVLAGGDLRVEFKDDTEANKFYWETDAADSYHVAGGTSTARVAGAVSTVVGVAAATGDPTAGDHIGNRDFNDARYSQPSGTITDNCLLQSNGTTGNSHECSNGASVATTVTAFEGLLVGKIQTTPVTAASTLPGSYLADNNVIINADNDALTLSLPLPESGQVLCLVQAPGSSGVLCLDPQPASYIVNNGIRGTIGTNYCSSGAATDLICVVAISTEDWRVFNTQGTWSE
jgi:hypothetical protein